MATQAPRTSTETLTRFLARKHAELLERLQDHYEIEIDQDPTALLTDALTDLRHIAHDHHVDFYAASHESLVAYQNERRDVAEGN